MFSKTFFPKSLHLRDNLEKYSRAGQAVDSKMRHICIVFLLPKVTNAHVDYVILRVHRNNGGTNAPLCYVLRTLPILLYSKLSRSDTCVTCPQYTEKRNLFGLGKNFA
jgi:hypothetical protein